MNITVGSSFMYSLPVSTWSQNGYDDNDEGCTLLVQESGESNSVGSITLGLVFLEQFTLAFNSNEGKIQVAPSLNAADGISGTLPLGPTPGPDDPSSGGMSTGGIVTLVIISILLIFLLILLCVWYIRKTNREDDTASDIDVTREILR